MDTKRSPLTDALAAATESADPSVEVRLPKRVLAVLLRLLLPLARGERDLALLQALHGLCLRRVPRPPVAAAVSRRLDRPPREGHTARTKSSGSVAVKHVCYARAARRARHGRGGLRADATGRESRQ